MTTETHNGPFIFVTSVDAETELMSTEQEHVFTTDELGISSEDLVEILEWVDGEEKVGEEIPESSDYLWGLVQAHLDVHECDSSLRLSITFTRIDDGEGEWSLTRTPAGRGPWEMVRINPGVVQSWGGCFGPAEHLYRRYTPGAVEYDFHGNVIEED